MSCSPPLPHPKKRPPTQHAPSRKNTFMRVYHTTPQHVEPEIFTIRCHVGKSSVFSPCPQKFLQICPYSETQNQFTKIYGLPSLTRQPSTHECIPPEPQKATLLVFFLRCPPKNFQMSSNPLKTARDFQQNSKPEIFKINNFEQIRKCPKQYFEHFHLTPFLPPPSETPIFPVPKRC